MVLENLKAFCVGCSDEANIILYHFVVADVKTRRFPEAEITHHIYLYSRYINRIYVFFR